MIHLTMQGKGGVGKSVVASLIAQNRRAAGIAVTCVDCDPINATLAGYEGLEAKALPLLDEGGDIAPASFDALVEMVAAMPEGGDAVVDTGATTFLPLSNYLVQHELPELLRELGHEITLHVVVPGGPALGDSLVGLEAILRSIQGARIAVWLNGYFGPLVGMDGKKVELEAMKVYRDHEDRIDAVIELRQEPALFAEDFRQMLSRKHTFAEALEDDSYAFMSRQRLRLLQGRLMELISMALGEPPPGLAQSEAANGEPAGKGAK